MKRRNFAGLDPLQKAYDTVDRRRCGGSRALDTPARGMRLWAFLSSRCTSSWRLSSTSIPSPLTLEWIKVGSYPQWYNRALREAPRQAPCERIFIRWILVKSFLREASHGHPSKVVSKMGVKKTPSERLQAAESINVERYQLFSKCTTWKSCCSIDYGISKKFTHCSIIEFLNNECRTLIFKNSHTILALGQGKEFLIAMIGP